MKCYSRSAENLSRLLEHFFQFLFFCSLKSTQFGRSVWKWVVRVFPYGCLLSRFYSHPVNVNQLELHRSILLFKSLLFPYRFLIDFNKTVIIKFNVLSGSVDIYGNRWMWSYAFPCYTPTILFSSWSLSSCCFSKIYVRMCWLHAELKWHGVSTYKCDKYRYIYSKNLVWLHCGSFETSMKTEYTMQKNCSGE